MSECVAYYKTRVHPKDGPFTRADTEFIHTDYCCDRMEWLWKDNYCQLTPSSSSDGSLIVNPVVSLLLREAGYDGIEENEFSIRFCPFCGASCRAQEEKRVRLIKRVVEKTETTKHTITEEQEYQ